MKKRFQCLLTTMFLAIIKVLIFIRKIHITPYEARLLKNNKNYTKNISMKIKNKIKYSFLIKQLIKSDVEIYCGLFSILCTRTRYGRKTEASLSQTENSAWNNIRIVLSLEVPLPPTLLACKNFVFGQQQWSECFPCSSGKLPGWDLLFLVHKAWDHTLLLFVGGSGCWADTWYCRCLPEKKSCFFTKRRNRRHRG